MNFQVIVTLGPSSLNEKVLTAIDSLGQCIYRVNGAHANSQQAKEIITLVRSILSQPKIMIDLPGNKIRTNNITTPIPLIAGESFVLKSNQINYSQLYKFVKVGDSIKANDSIYSLEVASVKNTEIILRSLSDGILCNNKGLHIQGIHSDIPFLFEKDRELIDTGCELMVDYLSLSFVRTASDIFEVQQILNDKSNSHTKLISKIETASAVRNLGYILSEVDIINVDRGDLSTDIGMLQVPATQERIINSAIRAKKQVFLATQFLKNMETKPVPLIAEMCDLHTTIKSGISGIQLSEETAIGSYPIECVKQVFDTFSESFAA